MSDVRIPRRALLQLAFGAAIAGVSRRSFAEPGESTSMAISGASFVLWVLAMDGQFLGVKLAADVASLAVLVWTTLVPALYRGDPAA